MDRPMDAFRAVMIAEGEEEADEATQIAAWQYLIDTGMCWTLQGWFGRAAMELIEDGVCTPASPNGSEGSSNSVRPR
jgi:hypothetical protein